MSNVQRLFLDVAEASSLSTCSISPKLLFFLLSDLSNNGWFLSFQHFDGFSVLEAATSTLGAKSTSKVVPCR